MNREKIGNYSIGYAILRVYAGLMHYLYYDRLRVKGREHVPHTGPVIFAPNHQNALMDALAVLFTYKRQMVFMARSDIFKKGIFERILTFLKILPIYRIRDGYAALQSNEEIFDQTVALLGNGTPLVILPEGNHAGRRRLRPLKKGIARIAFQAESARDFKLGIQIVPVGLDYSHYARPGGELLVTYGQPIDVSTYASLYRENPAKAHKALLHELSTRLSSLMVDIQSEDHYEMIDTIRHCYPYALLSERGEPATTWNRHKAELETVELLEKWLNSHPEPQEVLRLSEQAGAYREALEGHALEYRNMGEGRMPWWKTIAQGVLFLLFFPAFVYGLLNNILPALVPNMVVRRVKDVQFHSTFIFGLAIVTFPLMYALQTLLFSLIAPLPPVYTLWYLVSLPISGIVAMRYRLLWRRYLARVRLVMLSVFRRSVYQRITEMRDRLMGALESIRGKV